jgi:AraC-like DNA-binding protein
MLERPAESLRSRLADVVTIEQLQDAASTHAGLHAHSQLLVVFVADGQGQYRDGGERLQLSSGDVVITAPGQVHDAIGLSGAAGWLLQFPPELLGMAADGQLHVPADHPNWLAFIRPADLQKRIALCDDDRETWQLAGRRLAHELSHRPIGYRQAVAAWIAVLLLDAARQAFPRLAGPELTEEPLFAAMFRVIEDRYAEHLSLESVAAAVAVSPSHLARLARRLSGRTVNEWIAERRMVEARRLLSQTQETVDVIARRCGYTDIAHFRRMFRRYHGCSPGQWRRSAHA